MRLNLNHPLAAGLGGLVSYSAIMLGFSREVHEPRLWFVLWKYAWSSTVDAIARLFPFSAPR